MSKKIRMKNGYPVRDAEETLPLIVNESDIKSGVRASPGCCALWQCCDRQFNAMFMEVNQCVVFLTMPDENGKVWLERYIMDTRTRKFVRDFDDGRPVQAGKYHLCRPRDSEKLGSPSKKARSERSQKNKKDGKTKRQTPRKPRNIFARNGSGKVRYQMGTAVGKAKE